jgi:glycosyltransferase involved in cell wall biosynthesis
LIPSQTDQCVDGLPFVSIVTPSYNAAAYLRATIESVLRQGYPRFEHLVMDGGSTDGTMEILRCYPHLVWVSEKDRGQSHALNKGFQRAKGEIIGWLNADDTYEPNAILTAVQYFQGNPGIDMVCSDVNIINESGAKVGVSRSKPFDVLELLTSNPVKQPTVFMRRRVIDELVGVDEQYHYVMDHELWLRAGTAGFKMHYLQGITLANFRLCEGTKSFEAAPEFSQEWHHVLKKAFQSPFFEKVPESAKEMALDQTQSSFHLARMLEAVDNRNRRVMITSLVKAISSNKKLIWNAGTWKFLCLGLLGLKREKLRRFRKQAAAPASS